MSTLMCAGVMRAVEQVFQNFFYGAYAGLVYAPINNFLQAGKAITMGKKVKQQDAGAHAQPDDAVDAGARQRQASGAAQYHQGSARPAALSRQGRAVDPSGPANRICTRCLKP